MDTDRANHARALLTQRAATARARTSNRETYLPGVDGRSPAARRYHDITVAVINDQGGLDQLSEARLHLCKRLAAVNTMIEKLEAQYIAGEPINHDLHLSMVQVSVRLANTLGLNRKQKNIPTLEEYLGNPRNGNTNGHVARDGELIAPKRKVARAARIDDDDEDDD